MSDQSTPDLYFEDLSIGAVYETGSVTLTEQDVIAFARAYDPQPIHVDQAAAIAAGFPGLFASGWHTAALAMKLTAEAQPWGKTPILGLGVTDLRWPQPVFPGDTIQLRIIVESTRLSKSKPGFGIVTFFSTARNQRGEVVYEMRPSCWVPRKAG